MYIHSHLILDEEIKIVGTSQIPLLKIVPTLSALVFSDCSLAFWHVQPWSLSLTTEAISLSASIYLGSPELGQS